MSHSQQITIEQALSRAKKASRKRNTADALKFYTAVLQHQPNHPVAKKGLRKLQKSLPLNQAIQVETTDPSQDKTDALVKLYHSGQVIETELACKELLNTHAQSLLVLNILGAALSGQGKLQEAVESYDKAIGIRPDFAEAYSNRGAALKALGQLDGALDSFNKAIQLKPDYAEAYSNQGNVLQALGQFNDAVTSYESAIQLKPDYAEAYYNRGNVLHELGRSDEAVVSHEEAIRLNPNFAEAYLNLGVAMHGLGRPSEALEKYNKAIVLKPNYAEVYSNRGFALQELGELNEALADYCSAVQLKPDYAEAYYNRGNVLEMLGQLDEAVASHEKAIQLKPDYAQAYNNRGNVLRELELLNKALESYNKAVQLKPDYAEAHSNRGIALQALGQLSEAFESYNKAIQFKPDHTEAYTNQGNLFRELGQFDNSVAGYKKAIELEPDCAETYSNLGVVLKDLGQLDESVESLEKAIQLKPDCAEAHSNLGITLQELGRLYDSIASYDKAIRHRPDYEKAYSNRGNSLKELGQLDAALESFNKAIQLKPDYIEAYNNLLMFLNYTTRHSSIDRVSIARKFGELVTKKARTRFSDYHCQPMPGRLRVGFVSGDLRSHPVGYFLESILSSIDSSKIELIAYSTTPKFDALSERIKPLFSQWKPIYDQNDETAAKLIHTDGIHVLLDLAGHTAENRLPMFAYKPSPVQVSWLGYFATTGVNEMDYLLGDPFVTPPKYDDKFTEKVWRLPESRWCVTPPDVGVGVSALPALSNGYVTFGCFSNLTKVNDAVIRLWAKILAAIPNSRLLFKAAQFRDPLVRKRVIQEFAARGISSTQLTLEGPEARQKYFAAYKNIDITLDPFPFTGGTTSVDSLWMGVPLITLAGDSLASRQGVGVLMNAGLPDLIAKDEEEYLNKAVLFASDLDKLTSLRAGLRSKLLASPLFDAPRFARNFENALTEMWNQRNTS